MKLQDFHFVTPPKPKEEDYTRKVDGIERYYVDPQFEKDTAEWKRLHGDKPENYHQVRYPGWTEQQGEDYAFVKENEKELIEITFTKHSLKIQKCINGEWEPDLYYGEIPSFQLFELICKENGIEL